MAKKCNVPGCDQETITAGLCKFHYQMYFQKQQAGIAPQPQKEEKSIVKSLFKRKEPMQEAMMRQQQADQIKEAVMKDETHMVRQQIPEDTSWQRNYGKTAPQMPEPEPDEVQQMYDEAMQVPILNGTIVSIERKYDAIQQMQFMELKLQLFGENNFPLGNGLHLGEVKMLQDSRELK
jgi:hypothetical protein